MAVSVLVENVDAIPAELLTRLKELAAQVKSQDNACTSHPIFVVQQRRRIYGMDSSYVDEFEWIDSESNVADDEERERLEAGYQAGEDEPDFWTRTHYVDTWESVQPFFSRAAAEAYILRNRHNLCAPRIEVDSAYRNEEWQLVRALLQALQDSPRRPDGCEGFGRCHGTMRWCDDCGDVSRTCNDKGCDVHQLEREAGS